MYHRSVSMAFVALLLNCTSAFASEWVLNITEDPMDDTPYHVVFITNAEGYGFGARCSTPADIDIMFLAPDASIKTDQVEVASALFKNLGLKMRLRADKTTPVDFPIDLTDSIDGSAVFRMAPADDDAINSIVSAKNRLTIALAVGEPEKTMHQTSFKLPKSRKKLDEFLLKCRK